MKAPAWLIITAALLVGCDQPSESGAGTAAPSGAATTASNSNGQQAETSDVQAEQRAPFVDTGEIVPSKAPDTLRFAIGGISNFTLDPAYSYNVEGGTYLENMYETLVGYKGNTTDLEGVLATNWVLSEDGNSVRFDLRPGVKFHSGNSFTCADAEYTFRRNLVMNHPASSNWFLSQSLLGTTANAKDNPDVTWQAITNAVKCEGETLVMTMPKYDPTFVPKLAYVGQSIVDSKHAKAIGEWDGTEKTWKDWVGRDTSKGALNKQPSGTGPYQMVERGKESLKFKAFDGYWGESPALKEVIFKVVPKQQDRIQALLNDETDIVYGVGYKDVEGKPGIAIVRNLPTSETSAIGFNQNIKNKTNLGSGALDGQGIPADFFSDENVRLGFAHAFDKDKYIQQRFNGEANDNNFAFPKGFPGQSPSIEGIDFSPEKATEYFKKAYDGELWEKGFTLKQPYSDSNEEPPLYFKMWQEQLAAINPKFKIEPVKIPDADWYNANMTGQFPLNDATWYPDYADADNVVFPYLGTGGFYASPSSISDKFLDSSIAEARSAMIQAQRDEQYKRIADYANSKAFYVWMPTSTSNWKIRNSLQGFNPENYNVLRNNGILWKQLSKK